jgi:hypothetical protein
MHSNNNLILSTIKVNIFHKLPSNLYKGELIKTLFHSYLFIYLRDT